jgi:undecaprenyl-diphosphatase
MMSIPQAVILGVVEGVTEFLPVSSTGHLVIVSDLLGLRDSNHLTQEQYEATQAFEIVIQAGAILAVVLIFGAQLWRMVLGIMGRSPEGLRLLLNVGAAFIPTAVIGLLLHKVIKTYLQSTGPVIFALALGGVGMILVERSRWAKNRRVSGYSLTSLSLRSAVVIGLFQCVSMWPGTSRSMMTIIGGMVVGLHPTAAAEFSFILGLPTLLAATALKAFKEGHLLLEHIGATALAVGLVVAALSAFLAVKAFVAYLNKKGLSIFGWYRIALALVLWYYFGNQGM